MRQPGYYKVALKPRTQIEVAQFDGKCWWFVSEDLWFDDNEITVLDEHPIRLEPVNEKELDRELSILLLGIESNHFERFKGDIGREEYNDYFAKSFSQIKQLFRS